jgi:hypothetical protein
MPGCTLVLEAVNMIDVVVGHIGEHIMAIFQEFRETEGIGAPALWAPVIEPFLILEGFVGNVELARCR